MLVYRKSRRLCVTYSPTILWRKLSPHYRLCVLPPLGLASTDNLDSDSDPIDIFHALSDLTTGDYQTRPTPSGNTRRLSDLPLLLVMGIADAIQCAYFRSRCYLDKRFYSNIKSECTSAHAPNQPSTFKTPVGSRLAARPDTHSETTCRSYRHC